MQSIGPVILGFLWFAVTLAAVGFVVARLRPRVDRDRPPRMPIEHPLRRGPADGSAHEFKERE